MERQSLGLIETVGLVGAIEAADAAAKAAGVTLVKSEVTEASLVTVLIEGELGAVISAVDAGVAACRRVGRVLTHTVIPRPDSGLNIILNKPQQSRVTRRVAPVRRGTMDRDAAAPPAARAQTGPRQTGDDKNYEAMTVMALRRLARRRGDLPISGREIAHADRETLIRLLKQAP